MTRLQVNFSGDVSEEGYMQKGTFPNNVVRRVV